MKKVIALLLALCLLMGLMAACGKDDTQPGGSDNSETTTQADTTEGSRPENETTAGDSQETTVEATAGGQGNGQGNGASGGNDELPEIPVDGGDKNDDPAESTSGSGTQTTEPEQSTEQETVYTIKYENLSGATHTNPLTYTASNAANIKLSAPSKRPGYTFLGWYIGNTKVTALEGRTGNLTLTAKWKEGAPIELPNVPF